MEQRRVLLIIEDNPLLTGMYKAAFEQGGFHVLVAYDGEQGVGLAIEKKPDVILLDLLLPGMNGFEVLKRIRSDETMKMIKVVMLTIIKQDEEEQRAKKLGADDFLCKSDLKMKDIVERVISKFADSNAKA